MPDTPNLPNTIPYHPNEMGADSQRKSELATGLWGAIVLLALALVSLVIAVVCIPFVVFGLAEVASGSVTNWRVRWIRREHNDAKRIGFRRAGGQMTEICTQCFNAGWILDAKVDKEPTTLELIPCIHPECEHSGRDVAVLCLYGEWDRPVLHPTTGAVMSMQRYPDGPWRRNRAAVVEAQRKWDDPAWRRAEALQLLEQLP